MAGKKKVATSTVQKKSAPKKVVKQNKQKASPLRTTVSTAPSVAPAYQRIQTAEGWKRSMLEKRERK